MLRVFKNLRHQVIYKKKMYRYLIYASGEILLVVGGILIALQVNNWNEARKENQIEKELLLGLKEDLNETLTDLKSDVFTVNWILGVTDSLYQDLYIKNDVKPGSYKVPFWYTFVGGSLYSKQSAYQSIQSRGIHIIKNPNLRNAISDFYELFLKRIQSAENNLHLMQDNELNPAFGLNGIIVHECTDCQTLPEILDIDNQSPFNNKSYFVITRPDNRLEQQLMKYYRTNTRLLSLYHEAESVLQENIRLIDSQIDIQ